MKTLPSPTNHRLPEISRTPNGRARKAHQTSAGEPSTLRPLLRLGRCLALAAGILGAAGQLDAATVTWANVGAVWGNGTNWVGGVAPANSLTSDIAAFSSGTVVNPNITTQASINGLSFLSGASAYNLGGTSTFIIGANGISNSATNNQTISAGVRTSTSQTWTTGSGGLLFLSGNVDLVNGVSSSRTLTLDGAGNTTFNGLVQNTGTGSTGSITYNGSGSLTMAAANTYTGNTTLRSGTLNINNSGAGGNSSALGISTLILVGGSLDNTSGNSIILSSNNNQSWNGNFSFTGTNDLNFGTGAVTMNASRNIAVNGGNLTVGGVIQGSSFGITKTGSGTLRLSGTNTYTGATTIDSGTLAVDGSLASGSSVFVNSGGTLSGNGTVNGLATLNAGANLAPGNGVGALSFANGLTLNATSTVTMEINGDSTFDTISVTGGNLAYGGNLNLVFGYTPAVSSNFTLFTGGSVASATGNLTLNFTSNPGFDGTFDPSNGILTLTAVPEPKTLLLFALGASFLLWRARGRRAGS